jgi:hypothetical protein
MSPTAGFAASVGQSDLDGSTDVAGRGECDRVCSFELDEFRDVVSEDSESEPHSCTWESA